MVEGHQTNEKHLFYIYGGDGLAAIKTKTSLKGNITEGPLYYIHKDHLGSYQSISNSSGVKVEELSFGPWGQRREAGNWNDYSLSSTPIFKKKAYPLVNEQA